MPKFSQRALNEWFQIVASISVIAGVALLIVELIRTEQLFGSGSADRESGKVTEARRTISGNNAAEVSKARQSELRIFVAVNCPSCHGEQLAGSIGPALNSESLQHLSGHAVGLTILYGRPAKGMPPWDAQLSASDADWIADQLKAGSAPR